MDSVLKVIVIVLIFFLVVVCTMFSYQRKKIDLFRSVNDMQKERIDRLEKVIERQDSVIELYSKIRVTRITIFEKDTIEY